jgi:predicted nucleic acid-binding Zn ribbon protein
MTEQRDDPWASARASQRDDVRAVLAPRERRCPACGAAQRAGGRTCSECGADLTARFEKGASRRRWFYALLAVCAVAAVAVPVVGGLREDAAGERERAAKRQAALEAAERVRLTRDARPVRADGPPRRAGADPLEHRAALVTEAEELIAEDARGRVAAGRIKGDIRGAECDPFPSIEQRRAAEQDPSTRTGRYDCVAYTSKFEAPELEGKRRTGLFGYPYWLVIDYAGSKLVWCKVTPRAGEGGRSLASVTVPEPCRDPAGPG